MSSNPNPAELPPHIEAALGQIRASLCAGADAASKQAAATACRVLLSVLEAQPGQPISMPNASAPPPAGTPSATPPPSASTAPQAPIDVFLSRFVEKFGADVKPDPSVPYVRLGAELFDRFARIGGVR